MSIPLERQLFQFLNGSNASDPAAEALDPVFVRALHLGAFAYHHHTRSSEFRADYIGAATHHALTKKWVLELVRAWNAAGLEPILLKGFALAEFEYPHSAHRFYGDVDVWLSPQDAAVAAQIGIALGWHQIWSPETWLDGYKHEEAMLFSPNRQVMLEIHGGMVKARRFDSRLEQFTQKMVQSSISRDWEGVKVRVLEPQDALIFMLLDRAQGDRWGRKIFDVLDARLLIEKYHLSKHDVQARARELKCINTLKAVFQSFDPWQGRLQLDPPTRLERWKWSFQARHDFGFQELERLLQAGPRRLKWSLEALPDVLRAWFYLRRTTDMRVLLERMNTAHSPTPSRSPKRIQQIVQGAKWSLYLLGWKRDACVPRSLAVYAALRREGYCPQFVSGVRRTNGVIKGHAWVELDGSPIPHSGDENAPLEFKENFRYPPVPQKAETPLNPLEKSG